MKTSGQTRYEQREQGAGKWGGHSSKANRRIKRGKKNQAGKKKEKKIHRSSTSKEWKHIRNKEQRACLLVLRQVCACGRRYGCRRHQFAGARRAADRQGCCHRACRSRHATTAQVLRATAGGRSSSAETEGARATRTAETAARFIGGNDGATFRAAVAVAGQSMFVLQLRESLEHLRLAQHALGLTRKDRRTHRRGPTGSRGGHGRNDGSRDGKTAGTGGNSCSSSRIGTSDCRDRSQPHRSTERHGRRCRQVRHVLF